MGGQEPETDAEQFLQEIAAEIQRLEPLPALKISNSTRAIGAIDPTNLPKLLPADSRLVGDENGARIVAEIPGMGHAIYLILPSPRDAQQTELEEAVRIKLHFRNREQVVYLYRGNFFRMDGTQYSFFRSILIFLYLKLTGGLAKTRVQFTKIRFAQADRTAVGTAAKALGDPKFKIALCRGLHSISGDLKDIYKALVRIGIPVTAVSGASMQTTLISIQIGGIFLSSITVAVIAIVLSRAGIDAYCGSAPKSPNGQDKDTKEEGDV
jgi:hypothetical protein